MSDLKHARHLFAKAHKDFRALQGMSDTTVFSDEIFGFHAQQAIEKALKSWLAARSIVYPLKHDLSLLLKLLADSGADVSLFSRLDEYTDFAVDFRYLDIEIADAVPDRNAVCTEVKILLDHVAQFLG